MNGRRIEGSETTPNNFGLENIDTTSRRILQACYDPTLSNETIIKNSIDAGAQIDQLQMGMARGLVSRIRSERLKSKLKRK